jgi:hypothetical protein
MTFATAFDTGFASLAFKVYSKHFIVRAFSGGLSAPRLGSMVRLTWGVPRYLFRR